MRRTSRILNGFGVAIAILMVTATALAATVTGVTAKQRYPWNGMVDINCTVSGINGTTNGLEFSVATVNSGNVHDISQFWVVKDGTNSVDHTVHTNGTYHLVWNSKTDFDNQIYSNMVMRVNLTVIHDKVQLWENGPYWATTNIGAEEPYESGYYFWWGDTIGYERVNDAWVASDGSSSNFSFNSNNAPTYMKEMATLQSEEWITAEGVLAPVHDAAHVHWGGNWRMPTQQDMDGLNNNCDWTWTTMNGVSGYAVRGRGTYFNASIFLPAAGHAFTTSLDKSGSYGDYGSSVPHSDYAYNAWGLDFHSNYHRTYILSRYCGYSVRPLQDQDVNDTCTVTLDWQSGSGGPSSVTATLGAPMPTLADLPTRVGYTFGGYYTAVNGGGTEYYTAAGASARNWNIASDTTLYAKWTENSSVDTHDKVQLWEGGPYWATTNIGAEKPEDYGYYFWWGDTIGYERVNDAWVASDGSSLNFSFSADNTPTVGKDIAALRTEGWISADGVLAPEHDAAHVQWGGNWRMPTKQELEDLSNNCDWTWTTMNGVNGHIVRGRGGYASNSIFLPATGVGSATSLQNSGSHGIYLSSVPSDTNRALYLSFDSGTIYPDGCYYRRLGRAIRPLQGGTK